MGGLFNYENKFMQMLLYLGDLIILNVLFLICSIPIVTIGASQAGLYSGIRVLTDKEDDSSCALAFFKGFADGFTRITPVFCLQLVLLAASVLSLLPFDVPTRMPPWIAAVAFLLCCLFITMTCWFHARFSCTRLQLIKNAWFVFFAFPLRSLLISVVNFIPMIIFLLNAYVFMQFTPIFLSLGFSVLSLFSFSLMQKPFRDLAAMQEKDKEPEPEKETEEPIFHDELQDEYK